MKLFGKNGIGSVLKCILQISMVLGIALLLSLYWLTKWTCIHFNWFIGMIYPCGIGLLVLIYEFIGLFDSLKKSNPFCQENVNRMRRGMLASFIISIGIGISLLLTIFVYDYYSLQLQVALTFMCILFLGIAIALYILKELFKEAINYKEENELTI